MSEPILFEEPSHRYFVGGTQKPSVTQVLEAAGHIDLTGIPEDVLLRAALRGKRVHEAAVLLLKDQLEWSSVDSAIGGYVRALDTFLRHTGFTPVAASIEKPLYCSRYDYCGTPDVVGMYSMPRVAGPPERVLVCADWKTGMMTGVRLQLAAYAFALGVRHRVAIKLSSDGRYRMQWFKPETLNLDFRVFLHALDKTRSEGRWAA